MPALRMVPVAWPLQETDCLNVACDERVDNQGPWLYKCKRTQGTCKGEFKVSRKCLSSFNKCFT